MIECSLAWLVFRAPRLKVSKYHDATVKQRARILSSFQQRALVVVVVVSVVADVFFMRPRMALRCATVEGARVGDRRP